MDWERKLDEMLRGRRFLVIGMGNDMKGDDALGRYVIDRLRIEDKLFCFEMPENYIERIKSFEPQAVLIVDAVDFDAEPGEIVLADARKLNHANMGTHSLSFSFLAKMLPGVELLLLGVQPQSLEFGESISKKATESGDRIADAIDRIQKK